MTAAVELTFPYFAAAYVLVFASAYFTAGSMQALAIDAAPPELRGRYLGVLRLASECGTALSCVAFAAMAAAAGYSVSFAFLGLFGGLVVAVARKQVIDTAQADTQA